MATTPTQDAVPSESPRDLKFNAGKIDEFVTSLVNTYVDRFGHEHYTIEGLRWLAQQAIAQYGWILIDSFQVGADITLPNQALRDEATGEYYRWDGALPKHIDAGSTPTSSGGVGVGAWIGIGDASLRAMLSSESGAALSLSQVSTAYGLDFSLGGVWTEGAVSTVDNWWWYNNKVYIGGTGTLPASPFTTPLAANAWYPIRPGRELNLTDFIIAKGSDDKSDTVSWQWAFNAAAHNLSRGFTGVVNMDAREYAASAGGFIMKQGVSLVGSTDCMFGPDLKGKTVIYVSFKPSATTKLFTCYGNQTLKNFGVFYAAQTYSALNQMQDFGYTFYFDEDPALSGVADAPKGDVIGGVSVCGGSKVLYFAGASEYNDIDGFSATPSPFGPIIYCEIATDITRIKRVHLNGNVVSMYRLRYGVDITTRYLTRGDSAAAIGVQLNRWDGGNIIDMLQFGVPYGIVIGSISGGTAGCSVALTNCTFDYTSIPLYINSPQGAFGITAVNTQFAFGPQFGASGSIDNALVYLGANAVGHTIMLTNCHCQYGTGGEFRLLRGLTGSSDNKLLISNSRLTAYSSSLDSGVSNVVSIVGCNRNNTSVNRLTHITEGSVLLSSMGELNTLIRQGITFTLSAGTQYSTVAIKYPYIGWEGIPNVKTEVTSLSISGQPQTTMVTARAYSRTATGCAVQVNLSAEAVAAGTVQVDVYVIGTVRGVLTAI